MSQRRNGFESGAATTVGHHAAVASCVDKGPAHSDTPIWHPVYGYRHPSGRAPFARRPKVTMKVANSQLEAGGRLGDTPRANLLEINNAPPSVKSASVAIVNC